MEEDPNLPMDTSRDVFYFREAALAYAGYHRHDEDNPLHTHSFMEIAFAIGGTGTHLCVAGPRELGAGDVVLLRPGVWHGYENRPPALLTGPVPGRHPRAACRCCSASSAGWPSPTRCRRPRRARCTPRSGRRCARSRPTSPGNGPSPSWPRDFTSPPAVTGIGRAVGWPDQN